MNELKKTTIQLLFNELSRKQTSTIHSNYISFKQFNISNLKNYKFVIDNLKKSKDFIPTRLESKIIIYILQKMGGVKKSRNDAILMLETMSHIQFYENKIHKLAEITPMSEYQERYIAKQELLIEIKEYTYLNIFFKLNKKYKLNISIFNWTFHLNNY